MTGDDTNVGTDTGNATNATTGATKIWLNADSPATGTLTTGLSTTTAYISSKHAGTTFSYPNRLHEHCFYNAELSDSDCESLVTYLRRNL